MKQHPYLYVDAFTPASGTVVFAHHDGRAYPGFTVRPVCMGCGRGHRPMLAPAEVAPGHTVADGPEFVEASAFLCEPCSMRLPLTPAKAEWPELSALQVERLWADVAEQQGKGRP